MSRCCVTSKSHYRKGGQLSNGDAVRRVGKNFVRSHWFLRKIRAPESVIRNQATISAPSGPSRIDFQRQRRCSPRLKTLAVLLVPVKSLDAVSAAGLVAAGGGAVWPPSTSNLMNWLGQKAPRRHGERRQSARDFSPRHETTNPEEAHRFCTAIRDEWWTHRGRRRFQLKPRSRARASFSIKASVARRKWEVTRLIKKACYSEQVQSQRAK